MKKLITSILISSIVVTLLIACSQNPASNNASSSIIAITNGFLIDGTGTNPIPNSIIIIQNGTILSVGTDSNVTVPIGAEIIDVQGGYILPGFMNTHVHDAYSEHNLREWAKHGVTTVRDLCDLYNTPENSFSIRDLLLTDNRNSRLVAAGPIVTTVGGYGNYPVTSPADAEVKVNYLIDLGADLIKIAIENNLQGQIWPMLSMDEITMIVQTAHNREKKVSAHISRSMHLDMAIRGRVDDVAHMVVDNLPDSLITSMIQQDMYWEPTLELWKGVSQLHNLNWDIIAKNNLQRYVQAGGKVAMGTDYGGYIVPFDLGMPMTEIQLMQEAGMTPMQIIIAGTINAAHVCNMDNILGTIEVGKIADIIIVENNPLIDLQTLSDVKIVIHNGEIIKNIMSNN
ncbi:amidohydrolase family protein [Bacteroidota bacterium]